MSKTKKNKIKKNAEDIILDLFVYTLLIIIMIVTLYPMWYVCIASISDSTSLVRDPGLMLWPKKISWGAYSLVFKNAKFLNGFKNSLIILGVSIPYNMILTLLAGYFMAKPKMMWKKVIVWMMLFTMYFNGGLIPTYFNIKDLGLYNKLWALILPSGISVYNAIICRTSIQAIPDSLRESAYLDGANDIQVLFKIVVPLIKATLAVLILYYGVAHWNSWMNATIYLNENRLMPIQNVLRAVLMESRDLIESGGDGYNEYAETIKYAAIIVSTAPILCVYPFLQKYFVKGALIGAVKG